MKVLVDKKVVSQIDAFYIAAMSRHVTLSEGTVLAKKDRFMSALRSLPEYYHIYPKARLKKEWIASGWHEFICEDFHLAYEVCVDEDGKAFIWVRDAVHSLLYH